MISETDNPWVDRLLPLLDREEIRRRARVAAQPVVGLRDMPVDVACQRFQAALSKIFVPTERCCDILLRFVEIAIEHCQTFYSSRQAFLGACYAPTLPVRPLLPICLTGPAGVGKSALIDALRRILPADSSICLGPNGDEFRLVASWNINVQARKRLAEMLQPFMTDLQEDSYSIEAYQRHAFQTGVALLTADEFQSLTQSADANTLVAQRLLQLSYLQVPFIYIANYSLGHRLLRRPQEDRQRLLANPIVLDADAPNSADARELVHQYKIACHEYLDIDPDRDTEMLHRYSAGLKRLSRCLLTIAYRLVREDGRHTVTTSDIEKAYHSTAYTANRRDVDLMNQQWITGRAARPDLWCPFDLPPSSTKQFADHAKALRAQATAEAMLKSSMTAEERKAYAMLNASKNKNSASTQNAEVIDLARRKGITASELIKNARAFRDQL